MEGDRAISAGVAVISAAIGWPRQPSLDNVFVFGGFAVEVHRYALTLIRRLVGFRCWKIARITGPALTDKEQVCGIEASGLQMAEPEK